MNDPVAKPQGIQRKIYSWKSMVSNTFLAWKPCSKTTGNSQYLSLAWGADMSASPPAI
jgi:hypothetical protein